MTIDPANSIPSALANGLLWLGAIMFAACLAPVLANTRVKPKHKSISGKSDKTSRNGLPKARSNAFAGCVSNVCRSMLVNWAREASPSREILTTRDISTTSKPRRAGILLPGSPAGSKVLRGGLPYGVVKL